MIVTEQQIREGIANYITNTMITNVPVAIKVPLGVVAYGIKYNDNLLSNLSKNPIINAFLARTDGGYDLDFIYKALKESLTQYGAYTFNFLNSSFTFNADDVDLLKAEIERVKKNG